MKIPITKRQSLRTSEALLTKLSQISATEVSVPSSLQFGGAFGVEVALVQALLTWSRSHHTATVRVPGSKDAETGQGSTAFDTSLLGLASILLPVTIRDSHDNKISDTGSVPDVARAFAAMNSAQFSELVKGRALSFICCSRSPNPFPRFLYSRASYGNVRDSAEFQGIAKRILDACLGADKTYVEDRFKLQLGELIYELFRNSDQHATTNVDGNEYRDISFRALHVAFRTIPKLRLSEYAAGDLVLNRFFTRVLSLSAVGSSDARFIEFSVLDNGPGLARKYLTWERGVPVRTFEEIELEEEIRAVAECFKKHQSTTGSSGSGLGLSKVLNVLSSMNSFLRIRTGRLCYYQTFKPQSKDQPRQLEFAPERWGDGAHVAPVDGTLYTVCLPLG